MKNLSVKTEVILLEITKGYCNLNSIPKHNAASHGKTSYVDYMDLAVRCSRKAVKLNHSLTHEVSEPQD